LSNASHHSGTRYRATFESRAIPAGVVEQNVGEFERSYYEKYPKLQKQQTANARWAQATTEFLDALSHHWGKWKMAPDTGEITFMDKTTEEKFGQILENLRIAEEQQNISP
ncbi:MAG: hypothetical protein K0Q55_3735, partial [Verrucomicrobia bacterium]|nr:hypothetical protein [Verrucomicrobiota bacterium]